MPSESDHNPLTVNTTMSPSIGYCDRSAIRELDERWRQDLGRARLDRRGAAGASRRAPEQLYAALLDGTIKQSDDGGRTWTDLMTP